VWFWQAISLIKIIKMLIEFLGCCGHKKSPGEAPRAFFLFAALSRVHNLVAGAGFEPATFGL
jgi:hypothetical protein